MSLASQNDQDGILYDDGPDEIRKPFWVRHRTILLLVLILLGATFFRFIGRNFDQNTNQHPDERAIIDATLSVRWPSSLSQLFDPKTSTLNLRSNVSCGSPGPGGCEYPWGSLPVYLSRGAAWLIDVVLPPTDTHPKGYYLNDYNAQQMVGRTMASIFDLITVLLVFLIARRLYSSGTALIATALVAFAVTQIQIAHYYISEPFLVTFMVGAVYFSVVLMQRPSWWAAAGAGACLGFAVASKVTIGFFGLIIIAAIVLRAVYRKRSRKLGADLDDPVGMKPATTEERNRTLGRHLAGGLRYFLIAGVFTVIAFSISEPYALWQFDFSPLQHGGAGISLSDNIQAVIQSNPWTRRIAAEAAVQGGQADVPFTRQYIGTVPVLYQFEQLVLWGMGVIPGLVGLAGLLLAFWLVLRGKAAEILLLAGAIPYFLTIVGLESKWMRYMLPLVPIIAILGAALLVRGTVWARTRFPEIPEDPRFGLRYLQRNFFAIITVLAVGFAFLWSVAFSNIYTQDESRLQASAWMYDNIPDGATLSEGTSWDDALPLGLPTRPGDEPRSQGDRRYTQTNLEFYDDHPPDEELALISGWLKQTDYIYFSSDRLYGSIPRLPWRYPVQTMFYQLLYANKLGYVLVHTTQVTPELLGLPINDQLADESFTVYDHPRVDIFKKVSQLTDDQLHTLFSTALNRPPGEYSSARHGKVTDDNSLMLKGSLASQPDVSAYAWNPLAQDSTQWLAVLCWLVGIYLVGFAALPVVFTVFKRLPDRGYPLAKLVGLLAISWGTWILASARLMPFTGWSVLLMLALLGGLSMVTWRFGAKDEILSFIRAKLSLILFYEGIFLAGFAAFLVIRMLNPDLWHPYLGGEKPMEFGFLNAILRSPYMPPADPFFAGGSINYYYQGQFIFASLIKLVGVDSAIAFNLAIPLLYAMAFSVSVCLVYNLVAWSQRRRGSTAAVSRTGMGFGLLGGVLAFAIGNLYAVVQFLTVNFPSTTQSILSWGNGIGIITDGFKPNFDFWSSSRIIPGTINEFPYWSFLFADFHPHLIDMPFTLLAAVFAMNLAFAGRFSPVGAASLMGRVRPALAWLWGGGWAGALTFALMAVSLGTLFAVNSWDWPTYFGLAGGAALLSLLLSRKVPRTAPDGFDLPDGAPADIEATRLGAPAAWVLSIASAVSVIALGLVSLGAYLPFFLNFKAFYTQILPLVDGGLIDNTATVMHRTTLMEYLVVWAIFVFIAVSYLLFRLWSFPWSAALADLANVIPGGRQMDRELLLSPTRAFATERSGSVRRLGRLEQAPAFSGAAASFPLTFQSRGDDFSTSTSVTDPAPIGDGRSTEDDGQSAAAIDTAPDANLTGVSTLDSEDLTVEPYTAGDQPDSYDGHRDGGGETETMPSHWLSEAHSEVQRQAVPLPVTYQPGVIPLWAGLGLLALTAGVVVLQLVTHQFLLALLVALIGGTIATLLSTSRSVPALFGGLLLVTALLVSLGVEIVYLADHLQGGDQFRMNTVFKFYIQVWLLFATGSAVAIYYILFGLRERFTRQDAAETNEDGIYLPRSSAGRASALASPPLALVPAPVDPYPNGSENGASSSWPSTAHHANPEGNWLVWSADEIEEYGDATSPAAATPSEDEVASLVGLLPSYQYSPLQEATSRADTPPEGHIQEEQEAPAVETDNIIWEEAEPALSQALEPWPEPRGGLGIRWAPMRIAWSALLALFMIGSLVFTDYGTQDRLKQRFNDPPPVGTLNGTDYMNTAQYSASVPGPSGDVQLTVNLEYDREAIDWMNKNIPGLATIAELPVEYYRADGMRAASNTGLPMVVGGLHQDEQRAGTYSRLVGDRSGDISDFFSTNDIQRALTIISKYDIQYIYLGQLEQARAGEAGMSKFQQMADPKIGILTRVFASDNPPQQKGTIIYKVSTAANRDPKTLVGVPVANSGLPGISITPLPTSTPVPPPTPPVDNPQLKQLIADVTADPTNAEKRQALIDWYKQNGYHLEAAEQLLLLAQANPSSVSLWSQVGDEYTAANRPDDALKAWESGRDNSPNNPDAHNKVGIAYIERKRYDDAQREFQAAVNDNKNFVESWFHLGEVYERKGDVDNAKKAYQSAIDNSTDQNGWKDSAQQRLNALK